MTLGELKNIIRFEAQIKGPDTLVGFIDRTINEVLRKYTAKGFYQELLLTSQPLTNPGAGVQNWVLPSNIQHWLPNSVRFSEGGGYDENQYLINAPFGRDSSGTPTRFKRAGSVLQTWPYSDLATSAVIWIDYYKFPDPLILNATEFPISSLETVVKLETIARLSLHTDSKQSRVYKQEAMEAYNATAAQEDIANHG